MSEIGPKVIWRVNIQDKTTGEGINHVIPDQKFEFTFLDKYFCKLSSTEISKGKISRIIECDVAGTKLGTTTYCDFENRIENYSTFFFKNPVDNVSLLLGCQILK